MQTIQVGGWQFPSFNSTEGVGVDLFLSGCARNPKCEGCYNPYMWDFKFGEELFIEDIILLLTHKYKDADSIAILGGEPLNQKNIKTLLEQIKLHFPTKWLWLYTSYELEEIPEYILILVDYIKTGRYDQSLAKKGRLSSSNQKIWRREKDCDFFQYY